MSENVGTMSFETCGSGRTIAAMRRHARTIAFLGFDGVNALDLVGPLEAFDSAQQYVTVVAGLTTKPFRCESGVVMTPACAIGKLRGIDTLIVPGGSGVREPATNAAVANAVRECTNRVRRIASVCTGIYGVAPTGLLDGRNVTTHWRFAADVARRYPRLRVDANAIFIKDGAFYTSAGITAGIDLALALIEEDCGAERALRVARELVVHVKRAGGQEQFSEPLAAQLAHMDAFGNLVAWMACHLGRELTVDALAARVALSPRQFSRRFKSAFGATPAAFVERLRLEEARRQLASSRAGVDEVARGVGFASSDVFRRAFGRRYGVAPIAYRRSAGG